MSERVLMLCVREPAYKMFGEDELIGDWGSGFEGTK